MALREWYADRELLLTGATSDVGRALLEKVLRSFPHVKIYAIVRTRHGFTKDDRIKNIFLSPRFERLRQEDPNALSRVKAIEGNLSYNDFGMSERDKELLGNVSVVFHAAGPCNETFRFSKQLSRIQVVAVVTSIFERASDDRVVEAGKEGDDGPMALVRVPLVGPALREPMPGFVDTLKGSTALIAGAGHVLGNSNLQAEIIPIDLAVNTLITVAWERATSKNVQGPVIYNAIPIGCTWSDLIKKSQRANRKFAYPTFGFRGMTSIVTLHWALVVLFEWLPSTLCDTILGLVGAKKRFLVQYQRVRDALRSVESISSRVWSVERNRVYLVQQRLATEDQDIFPVSTEIDVDSYALCAAAAAKKYCVDEGNISLIKIFRLLFLLLIAALLFCTFFFSGYHVLAKHTEF
ncbi:putative fatty acyl-CoA reductase CG5065 isoform X1 [Apis cerana]|uniref:putative fatty acyl-CoA reductase CG5065 isoform X1 n=1 Tax=Apis cerana TaxID=7461 RepID=UPI002B2387F6|nr:putative fatty acyl-CoA reductase CG5065 isoform X1 [Apis cerana]